MHHYSHPEPTVQSLFSQVLRSVSPCYALTRDNYKYSIINAKDNQ